MVAELLAGISPSEHVKSAAEVQLPCEAVIVPRVKPPGQVSTRLTLAAGAGPALLTVIVYVRVIPSPAVTVVTPSDFVTDRSELVLTVTVLLDVLLPASPSGVLLLTPTVFVCGPPGVVEGTV